ncbi:FtsX-like permease family protein [Corynebacterium oculi]|uniref:FtsX-like permease family protein n=1 Tax=Corynebacterium oculi TaxID=1544416 RepID=A0A0Q0TX10_9CORY|nr:FtsX-like permease family protein [Corynebacterium oculi]KQB83495.1 FtsX-like permease family protein [Corynebacterium oculi]
MPSLIVPARLARRDIAKHRWRSLVAVLFFALPIALVTLLGFMNTSATYSYGDGQSGITLAEEGTGTDMERIRAVFPDEELVAKAHALATVHSGEAMAYLDVTYASNGADTLTIPEEAARALGVGEGDTVEVQAPWEEVARPLAVELGSTRATLRLSVPAEEIVSADFPAPVSWYGTNPHLDAITADVQAHPVTHSGPEPSTLVRDILRGSTAFETASLVTLGLLALIVLAAMISPIFAVAARRQYHSMRLLSINGAAPAQLRWTLYFEALAISAVGIVLGLALGIAGFFLVAATSDYIVTGFVVPLDIIALSIASSLFCALAAAVIPAVRASRLRSGDEARLRWRWPMSIGPAILVFGLLLTLSGSDWSVVGYGIFGIGAVTSTPALLWLLSRWAARGPVPLRLALRDLFRQVHRTAPAIAAILGLSFVIGVMSLGSTYQYVQGDGSNPMPVVNARANVYLADSAPVEKEIRELSQAIGGVPPVYVYKDLDDKTLVIDPARLPDYLRYTTTDMDAGDMAEAQRALERGEVVESQFGERMSAPREGQRTYLDRAIFFPERELTMRQEFSARRTRQELIEVSFTPDHLYRLREHYIFPLTLLSLACLAVMILLAALSVGETRADLVTMWAVGAPPRLLSRISAMQSLLIAVIGVASGLLATLVVQATARGGGLSEVPWSLWLLLLVAVPLLGWASGGITAAVSHRRRSRRR